MDYAEAFALADNAIQFGESVRVTSADIDMILDTADSLGITLFGDGDEGDVAEYFDMAVVHGDYRFIFGCDGDAILVDATTVYYLPADEYPGDPQEGRGEIASVLI
jgi:hypothetical protein